MKIGHHRITRVNGGSWDPSNIQRVEQKDERNMHNHHGVRLPHEKWLHDMDDWDAPVLIEEARRRIHAVIDEIGPDMYRKEAVRDWRSIEGSFARRKSGIIVPKTFHE